MSGFGLRAFKRLKEESIHDKDRRKYYSHIVVGNNTMAILKYLSLIDEVGSEHVALITDVYVDKASLLHQWRCSMHTIRSEELANIWIGKAPELELTPVKEPTQFYKDTKLHPFGGRAKPIELLEGEERFQEAYYKANWKNLFNDEQWEGLDEVLKGQFHKYLDDIEVSGSEPTDLVEKTRFKLHTGEFECFECENLHWFQSPKTFVSLVKDKTKLPDDISTYGLSIQDKPAVVVCIEAFGPVYESEGTIFLPQSLTHEWGHFIFDFDKYNPETNSQAFKALILLHDDEVSSEDLAKKIKLMKRVLSRVFPEFIKYDYTEHIRYDEQMFTFGENKKFEHVEFIHTL